MPFNNLYPKFFGSRRRQVIIDCKAVKLETVFNPVNKKAAFWKTALSKSKLFYNQPQLLFLKHIKQTKEETATRDF